MSMKFKEFRKKVQCPHCETVLRELVPTPTGSNRGWVVQNECAKLMAAHLATCEKAPPRTVGEARKVAKVEKGPRKNTIKDGFCPFCCEEMRLDNVKRHVAKKHAFQAVLSTLKAHRAESLRHRIPLAICRASAANPDLITVCLECCVGSTSDAFKNKGHNHAEMARKHADCVAKFDRFKELFEMEEFEPVPFLLDGKQPSAPVNTVVLQSAGDAKAPPSGPAISDALQDALIKKIECDPEDLETEAIEWLETAMGEAEANAFKKAKHREIAIVVAQKDAEILAANAKNDLLESILAKLVPRWSAGETEESLSDLLTKEQFEAIKPFFD